jgi:hypothetical protein
MATSKPKKKSNRAGGSIQGGQGGGGSRPVGLAAAAKAGKALAQISHRVRRGKSNTEAVAEVEVT